MNVLIPKIIHITWKTKQIKNHPSDFIQNGLGNLIKLNPNWQLSIHDDEEVEEYIKNNLDISDYDLYADCNIVEKTDIWRLIKIYIEGGLYCDLDRLHNIPLDNILDEQTKCVLPTCLDFDFSHTFIMSAPRNPIYLTTINLILERRWHGYKNTYFLGPQTYMHGITKSLMGEIIDSNPGIHKFDEIRNTINSLPFLKTYRESPPGDLITNKLDITEQEYENQKRCFYKEFGVKHWTGLW
jgi:mannosyltransferase OCH1-like enzyme